MTNELIERWLWLFLPKPEVIVVVFDVLYQGIKAIESGFGDFKV